MGVEFEIKQQPSNNLARVIPALFTMDQLAHPSGSGVTSMMGTIRGDL